MPTVDKKKILAAFAEVNPGKVYFVDRKTGDVLAASLEEKAGLERIKKMIMAEPTRFIQVPKLDARQNMAELEQFIAAVHDPKLKEALQRTLSSHRPFREFQDILNTKVKEKREWEAFHHKNVEDRVTRFLKGAGLQ